MTLQMALQGLDSLFSLEKDKRVFFEQILLLGSSLCMTIVHAFFKRSAQLGC